MSGRFILRPPSNIDRAPSMRASPSSESNNHSQRSAGPSHRLLAAVMGMLVCGLMLSHLGPQGDLLVGNLRL